MFDIINHQENADLNYNKIALSNCDCGYNKNSEHTKCW